MLIRCALSLGAFVLALACIPNEPGAEAPDDAGPPPESSGPIITKDTAPYLEACGHITDLINNDLSQRSTPLTDEQASTLTSKCVADLADERETIGEQMSLGRVDCVMQAEQVEALLTCDLDMARLRSSNM